MKLQVLYFARLRDAVGRSSETIDAPPEVASVGQLRAWLAGRGSPWQEAFEQVRGVRSAVDQVMADDQAPLRDGAEVAFFPPVTGG